MKDAETLRRRVNELRNLLKEATNELNNTVEAGGDTNENNSNPEHLLPPPGKSGYLFKWQDRSIGWSGTKWALRYVNLDRGRISYYLSHLERAPRYVLSLRGCAVRDDGWKRNRRHTSKTTPRGKDPPIDEVGAYFFVFSIYHRPDSSDDKPSAEYVSLLRFSTPSLAEKTQWIQLLSEACAYCETDAFLAEEALRNVEQEERRQQQINMAMAMPQAERGTLPALYFAPDRTRGNKLTRSNSSSKLPKSNMFRTQSKSRDADKVENTNSTKGYPPSKPMHRTTGASYLSAEAAVQNYRGFFNLAIIILIVSNLRLLLHTVQHHGFVFADISKKVMNLSLDTCLEQLPFVAGMMILQGFLITAYLIETMLSKNFLYEPIGMILHHINAHTSLATSIAIVWNHIETPAVGGCLIFNAIIVWMKLISYFLANEDYRLSAKSKEGDSHQATLALIDNLDTGDFDITYPRNVTLGNIYYFWFAPTLTYQIAFPKTPRVRFFRVAGILFRMVMTFSIFTFCVAQLVAPNLESLLNDLDATNGVYTWSILAEYWLKLSIANTYLWLLVFYFYFHLWLNLFAEVLRFGDRVFYKDWWNSSDVSSYWRLWNLPVHYWLIRHLYFPCIRFNMSKTAATFIVFLFSAIMHEILISVPFQMLRPWSFLGMMSQLPLVGITKYLYRKYPGSSIGNVIFWVSFCVVGQPMAILLYTIDYKYLKLHSGNPAIFDS